MEHCLKVLEALFQLSNYYYLVNWCVFLKKSAQKRWKKADVQDSNDNSSYNYENIAKCKFGGETMIHQFTKFSLPPKLVVARYMPV